MTEQKEETKSTKPLSLSTTARTGAAAKADATQVRQKFSHGRTRAVTVEVKKPVKRPVGAAAPVPAATPAPAAAAPTPAPAAAAPAAAAPAPAPQAPKPAAVAAPAPAPAPAPTRTLKIGGAPAPAPTSAPPSRPPSRSTMPSRPTGRDGGRGIVLRTLTEEEKEARARALVDANRDAEIARQRAAEEAVRRAAEEEVRKKADEEHKKRLAEEEARKKTEEEVKRKADAQVQKRLDQAATAPPQAPIARQAQEIRPPAPAATPAAPSAPIRRPVGAAPTGDALRRPPPRLPIVNKRLPPPSGARREAPKRRNDKVDVGRAVAGENDFRSRSVAQQRRRLERERRQQFGSEPQQKVYREVTIPETITVQELAARMTERGADVIKTLMRMGVMATINQAIDADTAELVVTEMGHRSKRVAEGDVETGLTDLVDAEENMLPRPPVVTIMGHVDHGKTSLLDALRATDVAAHEAGGITQHIGAYQVTLPSQQKITFLDTPGHEAFTAMRARGAKVTDIVVLVVAGDDGVMPQTKEAIAHAKAAGVPIIVAINKMDKPGADPNRVRTELLQDEIQVEQLGGDVQSIEVSATKRINLDKLEEAILLQSEVLELKANPDRPADGVVVEAKLDPGRGSVATVLVQRGTLKVGDILVAGSVWGRVRRLVDDRGNAIENAGPAFPVEILGLDGTPQAGDEFHVMDSEARAREIADFRARRDRQAQLARAAGGRGTLEEMIKGIREGTAKELPVLIKADVQGSAEALAGALARLSTDKVATRVVYSGVGGISEADITLAKASGALLIGFNVRANPQAREIAKRDKIDIRYYSIIYKVTEDIQALMVGLLDPTYKETFLGNAQIREVFRITKVGNVAGCMVTEGQVKRGAKVRLLRDNVVIHEGTLKTLRRFKEEVREVQHGFECGMAFENYDDIKVGDVIECFDVVEVTPTL
ncbi:translation initiation factor IF-2 [Reyranella sp.]|uniref:translation initiation factor IF-2 n=1 Tax=Reyranella sp. TaxID=1929291 RepID=UPI0012117C1B|nr:translation initiation factor IF-2 [Reyranella sp.]TAJ88843.1 MAG: translation initiation factor IF-2 [Reyranella sp.]